MTRAAMTVLGAILGFVEGFVFFVILNVSLDAPLNFFFFGDWIDYSVLIFGAVGATCGAVLGWSVYAWTRTPRRFVSVPRKRMKPGDRPSNGFFG